MRSPNIGTTIITDVFVGRPEHVLSVIGSVIGLVEHRRAVITYALVVHFPVRCARTRARGKDPRFLPPDVVN